MAKLRRGEQEEEEEEEEEEEAIIRQRLSSMALCHCNVALCLSKRVLCPEYALCLNLSRSFHRKADESLSPRIMSALRFWDYL
jgi:hypothetical protein